MAGAQNLRASSAAHLTWAAVCLERAFLFATDSPDRCSKQLRALCGQYQEQARLTWEGPHGSITIQHPKKRLRVTPPWVLSPARGRSCRKWTPSFRTPAFFSYLGGETTALPVEVPRKKALASSIERSELLTANYQ